MSGIIYVVVCWVCQEREVDVRLTNNAGATLDMCRYCAQQARFRGWTESDKSPTRILVSVANGLVEEEWVQRREEVTS